MNSDTNMKKWPAKKVARLVIGVLFALILVAGIFIYLQAQIAKKGYILSNPLHFLKSSKELNPPNLGFVGEAELALSLDNWDKIDGENNAYSGSGAVFTRTQGERLEIPVEAQPGKWNFTLWVWSYGNEAENQVTVQLGEKSFPLSWSSTQAMLLPVTLTVDIDNPVDLAIIKVDKIEQFACVIDKVNFAPLQSASHFISLAGTYISSFLVVLFVLACALSIGLFFLDKMKVPAKDVVLQFVFGAAIGFVVLYLMVMLTGLLNIYYFFVILPLLLLMLVAGFKPLYRFMKNARKSIQNTTVSGRIIFIVIGIYLLMQLPGVLTPALGVDGQIYHLPIAKQLVLKHGFRYYPGNFVMAYPHAISNLYSIPQLLYNEAYFRPAMLMNMALGCLLLVSIYALGKTMFSARVGMLATCLFLGVEGFIVQFSTPLVDLGFTFFAVCSLLALAAYISTKEANAIRLLWVAAAVSGIAAACKVNGPSVAIAVAIGAAAFAWKQQGWKASLKVFFTIGIIAAGVAFPMYLKNIIYFHNPVYPFFFGGKGVSTDLSNMMVGSQHSIAYMRLALKGRTPFLIPAYWLNSTFVDPLSPGPALFAGILLLLFNIRTYWKKYYPLLITMLVMIVFWSVISSLTRFAYPFLIILFVFAASPIAIASKCKFKQWAAKYLVPIILIISCFPVYIYELNRSARSWNCFVGVQSEDEFIANTLPMDTGAIVSPPLEGIKYLNTQIKTQPTETNVLLDTNIAAYADFNYIPSMYYIMMHQYEETVFVYRSGFLSFNNINIIIKPTEFLSFMQNELNADTILIKKMQPDQITPGDIWYSKNPEDGSVNKNESVYGVPMLDFCDSLAEDGLLLKLELTDSYIYTIPKEDWARGYE